MPRIIAHLSVSLDGFVAGPDQSIDQPLGAGGLAVHTWHLGEPQNDVDRAYTERLLTPLGAVIMGRNMFGPVRGPWPDDSWRGWWGEDPPYHAPVFVLTHHPREPVPMEGGTTFYFVDGIAEALRQATEVAGDRPIRIAGGASTVRQVIAAGALDELTMDVAPVLLGSGERLLDGLAPAEWEAGEVAASPLVTHLTYRLPTGG